MRVRYLSEPELAGLSSWPGEIADEDAVTYFTLSADDLLWLAGFNRQQNRLGVAVQLSAVPWLGWIPDDLAGCPPMAVDRLAESTRQCASPLVTNACVLWTTTYLGDAIVALRADGIDVTDEIAAHLTPAQHDHINFYGIYSFDIDAELRREGHRPLRIPA